MDLLQETQLLERLLKGRVDYSHGIEHALSVLHHVEEALKVTPHRLTQDQILSIRLAALLHDADDRKYFPDNKNYENARVVLGSQREEIRELALRMIDLVSCTKNGNSRFAREWNGQPAMTISEENDWMLYPRWADRLEAMGHAGILRTWLYNRHVNRPDFTPDTLRPKTIEELYAVASEERMNHYLSVGGNVGLSSLIDHYYDKLFRIFNLGGNPYFKEESAKRHRVTEEFLLEFGRIGAINHAKWGLIERNQK